MIDIYLKNDKSNEEDSYNIITMDNVNDAKYSDDEKYLILFSQTMKTVSYYTNQGASKMQTL